MKKSKCKSYVILCTSCLIFMGIIFISGKNLNEKFNNNYGTKQEIKDKEITKEEESNLQNNEEADNNHFDYTELEYKKQEAIIEIVSKHLTDKELENISMSYYDINSNKYMGINDSEIFLGASTTKVLLDMIYYDAINNGKIDINSTVEYKTEDYEDGCGVLTSIKNGQAISIGTLLKYSIVYSDNIAKNMLYRNLGYEEARKFFNSKVEMNLPLDGNYVTSEYMARALIKLYNNEENNPYYKTLLNHMNSIEQHDRLTKFLPQDKVAHKFGDYEDYANDIAIIYKENKPYILTFFTKNLDNAYEKMAKISKEIYENNLI